MAAPTIDPNQWYHLYVNEDDRQSLHGTALYAEKGTKGAIFINNTDTSVNTQRWQIFPAVVNGTKYYTLRCKESGPNAFMGAGYVAEEVTAGSTRPQLFRGDIVRDNGVLWSFGSWNDGTWFLTNAANTTKYQLNKKPNGQMALDSDTKAPQNGQRWNFGEIAKIDDDKYSSVNLQVVMTMASSTSASTATPTSNVTPASAATTASISPSSTPSSSTDTSSSSSPNDSSSSGLSTGAKAGIGVGIGGAILIALLVIGVLFWKKRSRRAAQAPAHELPPESANYGVYHHSAMNHDSAMKYEMSSPEIAEVPNHERPVELPGHVVHK